MLLLDVVVKLNNQNNSESSSTQRTWNFIIFNGFPRLHTIKAKDVFTLGLNGFLKFIEANGTIFRFEYFCSLMIINNFSNIHFWHS